MGLRRIAIFPVRLLVLCLLVSFFAPVAVISSTLAFAASNPITITSQTDTIHFPQSLDFQMSARDGTSTITKAIIYIQYGYSVDGTFPTQRVAKLTPGHTVTVDWHENTTGTNFLPAGTSVSYYWLLYDNNGNSYTGQKQQFHTIDTRFPWQHLTQGFLQVNWYNRPQDFGQNILGQASTAVTRISHTLGGGLKAPINLWVYQTDQDFHGSLSPDTHEWVGGIAFPTLEEASIVVMDTSDETLVRDMPHELTHLIFHQLIGEGSYPPTWFDEGLAVYNQQYHEAEMTSRLQQALNTHTLLPLNQISLDFPADANQAYLAYAQSWNLVSYMYSTFGQPKMGALIQQMSDQRTDFGRDLELVLNMDQDHLENQWHLALHQPPTLPADELTPTPQPKHTTQPVQVTITDNNSSLLISVGIALVLLPLAGITFIFINQRRKRQKTLAVQTAQQIVSANRQAPQVLPQQQPYAQPQRQPYPPKAAYPNYPAYQPYPPNSQLPHTPVSPPQEWSPSYPTADPGRSNGNGAYSQSRPQVPQVPQSQPQPFVPGQEYLNQPPRKQAPQE